MYGICLEQFEITWITLYKCITFSSTSFLSAEERGVILYLYFVKLKKTYKYLTQSVGFHGSPLHGLVTAFVELYTCHNVLETVFMPLGFAVQIKY